MISELVGDDMVMLVEGCRRGDYGLPRELLTPYEALERVLAAPLPEWESELEGVAQAAAAMVDAALRGKPTVSPDQTGRRASEQFVRDWARVRNVAAAALADKVGRSIAYQGASLIAEYIQPAFATLVESLTADVHLLGHYANEIAPTIPLLLEPDDIRQAYVRLTGYYPKYANLRAGWAVLRTRDRVTDDPRGTSSPLADLANLPDVVPDWFAAAYGHGEASWPWQGAAHTRLSWLVVNGVRMWCPTAAEQNEAWQTYRHTVGGLKQPLAGNISHVTV